MPVVPPMTSSLENPPENPCFGCGPRHPRGLRLAFEETVGDDGERVVRTTFTPKADEIGWPTLFHHGLHFMALYETSYWTALTLGGKVWVSYGPIAYTSDRLPRVGVEHRAIGRIVRRDDAQLTTRAISETLEGKSVGVLEATWRPASRAVVEKARVPLPDYLLEAMAP